MYLAIMYSSFNMYHMQRSYNNNVIVIKLYNNERIDCKWS